VTPDRWQRLKSLFDRALEKPADARDAFLQPGERESQRHPGFYAGSDSPQGSALLYVDLKGSARALWQYKGGQAGVWSVPSPDGRYLAIGHTVRNSNVWVIKGF
jgi:hypothetical protein